MGGIARDDTHLLLPSGSGPILKEFEEDVVEPFEEAKGTPEEKRIMKIDAFTGFAEERLRHTWELECPPSSFYRFFRIIGPGKEEVTGCLHGVGFELYGDVQALQQE